MVVIVLGLIATAIVPIYSGSISKARTQTSVEHFIQTMEYARDRAVMAAVEHRFYFNDETGAYWVLREDEPKEEDERNFVSLSDAGPDTFELQDSVEIRSSSATRDRDRDAEYIAFYPTGACDFAKVTLRVEDERRSITIETEGMLGRFKVSGDL